MSSSALSAQRSGSELRLHLPPENLQEAVNAAIAAQLAPGLRRLRLIDSPQAADLLGVSTRRFLSLARDHGLKAVSFGPRSARWSLADIESLIEAHRVEAS